MSSTIGIAGRGATNSPGEVTAAVRRFIAEAYAVGRHEHLAR